MCWSATADLAAGVGIAAVGVACVTAVARAGRVRDLPLAALPLLLGAHQIVESLVWRADGGTGPATVAWTVIALPLLALWVPAAVLCAAPGRARHRLLLPLAAGVVTSAALAYNLSNHRGTADIRGHTIGYGIRLSHSGPLLAGYLIATVGALLLSGDHRLVVFGLLVGTGALVCWALWRLEFVSTWCALAALCSLVLLGWARGRPPPRR
ncbi:DUF6629 family protein [Streptomyces sp. WI04-05B]|uniref:DUF6629 family protein n=1 Tax=Streptomyces TaxID=1883 RepID=UPI0029BB9216|nr:MULTISPECIES: DUF6629 family protein [unclassified Streptomyces]MDX2547415.1 hypothetical protein [Streptomyces sp. WI04-05B]MDX2586326.1 hypothetical protein [Streptomyces sp. WI04-05A]MDX3748976.1 hypothetical protein [Streptomyces sp. AK08-02]